MSDCHCYNNVVMVPPPKVNNNCCGYNWFKSHHVCHENLLFLSAFNMPLMPYLASLFLDKYGEKQKCQNCYFCLFLPSMTLTD